MSLSCLKVRKPWFVMVILLCDPDFRNSVIHEIENRVFAAQYVTSYYLTNGLEWVVD